MDSLNVAVVEDEPLARERLSRLLKELGCEVVAELEDGRALLDWMRQRAPVDGLFLDIQMPGGTGLEILAELEAPPPVVFVTAYADHAVRAFESEAVDYVLKPVFKDRLEKSVARLRARQVPIRSGPALRALASAPASPRFPVKAGVGHVFLELRRVTHFELEGDVVWAWSQNQRFRTGWGSIGEVEAAFPETGLLRIQRHILLRPEMVLGHRSLVGGRCRVRIAEGLELEVSRGSTPRLKERLGLA